RRSYLLDSPRWEQPPTMAWAPPSRDAEIPARPQLNSQQSSSLPSTPYQHARNLSFHSRTPSPARGSSPRSTHSESAHFSPQKVLGGCKYETAMTYYRRRIPYSLGSDLLPEEKEGLKEKLDAEEDSRITADIMNLYDQLLPSAESDDRRRQLVQKLERLFNEQWPGHNIKANVFGSSGNKLCSSDSDGMFGGFARLSLNDSPGIPETPGLQETVDICITTDFRDLEQVCLLADVLAKHGMERVVCVSHAKVPIVKIWDPELKLACDMNVNNTLALENTRMIRTYVEADERVRPLAMSVKHWTKRRVLNDAGSGGTLSSYTWICLIINFLQTRDPPILPSLQARPHRERIISGLECGFDDDPKSFAGFGRRNKQSVGELLFEFFRYYGHEINYEKSVVSVREGRLISKVDKKWHLATNNRLCVEEPFNTERNLGNTADDTSFKGLHLELRRSFNISPKQTCLAPPRHVITPIMPTRGGRAGGGNGNRAGGRYNNQYPIRGGFNGGRRASNTGSTKGGNGAPGSRPLQQNPNMPELSMQAQQQAQSMLADQLFAQIQVLQAQEQELRLHLQQQAMAAGRRPPLILRTNPFLNWNAPQRPDYVGEEFLRSQPSVVPSLAPGVLHNNQYLPTYASVSAIGTQGSSSSTNPSSPSVTAQDFRPEPRRGSAANGSSSNSSLRAQSQPARAQHSPSSQQYSQLYQAPRPFDTSFAPSQGLGLESEGGDGSGDESSPHRIDPFDGGRSQDYLGYLSPSQEQLQQHLSMLSLGAVPPNGYASSYLPMQHDYQSNLLPSDPQSGIISSEAQSTRSEQTPTGSSRSPAPPQRSTSRPAAPADRGPLIVDGSVPPGENRVSYVPDLTDSYTAMTNFTSNSDDQTINTPASFSDSLSQDFQDPAPFEMDQPGFSRLPNLDTHNHDMHNHTPKLADSQLDGGAGSTQLLASRLQNLHLSNAERLAQSQSQANQAKSTNKGSQSQQGAKESAPAKSSSNEKAAHNQANDGRQQTSNKRRPNGGEADKQNGVNHHGHGHGHKPKAKGRNDHAASDAKERQAENSSRKANGLTNGPEANHGSGWQTTKKKNRRSKVSADSRNGGSANTEPPPVDESQRKGG
ncbi:hypothetical protein N7470_006283, partial [Penicillium chermesinum]